MLASMSRCERLRSGSGYTPYDFSSRRAAGQRPASAHSFLPCLTNFIHPHVPVARRYRTPKISYTSPQFFGPQLESGKTGHRVHDRVHVCICPSQTVPRALRRLRAARMRKAKSKLLVSIAPAVRSRAALLLCAAATVPSSTGAITKVRS